MTLNLKFEAGDFENMRSFEKAVQRQVGNTFYAGTDSLVVWFGYPKELKAMLRPYPEKQQFEFELTSSNPELYQGKKK